GSHVTVLDHHQTLLPREDDDVAEMVIQNFKDNGVRFEVGVDIKAISEQDEQAAITFARADNRETTIFADKILVATGRKPATADLDLQNTDIKVAKNVAIVVDDLLHTSVPNVWVIGDVKGGRQFTYISLDHFRIIKHELSGTNERHLNDRLSVLTHVHV